MKFFTTLSLYFLINSILFGQYEGPIIPYHIDTLWGYCDTNKNFITPIKYDKVWWFNEGLGKVRKNGKSGFVNREGKEIIPLIYDYAGEFDDGLYKVRKDNEGIGYINTKGEVKIPLIYSSADYFRDGKNLVSKIVGSVEYYGYIDTNGNTVLPFQWIEKPVSIGENCYRTGEHSKAMIYDSNGKIIYQNGSTGNYFRNGLLRVWKPQIGYGYINNLGKIIIPYGMGIYKSEVSEGTAKIKSDGKWGFVDTSGSIIIQPKYDKVGLFHNGIALAKLNGKYGLINKMDSTITPFQYDSIEEFVNGLAIVKQKEKEGCLNSEGEIEIPLDYEIIEIMDHGFLSIKEKGKYGLLNHQNEWIVNPKYDTIEGFYNGLVRAGIFQKYMYWTDFEGIPFKAYPMYKFCIIDSTGKELFSPKFHEIDINYGIQVEHGLVIYRDGRNRMGVSKLNGDIKLPSTLSYAIIDFEENGNIIIADEGGCGVVDSNNTIIITPKYHEMSTSNHEGFHLIEWFEQEGYVSKNGKEYFELKAPGKYPFTAVRKVTNDDLIGLSKWDLSIMRNEIYARYDYRFKNDGPIENYFFEQNWYTYGEYDDTNKWAIHNLSDLEKKNIAFIKAHENKLE